MRSRVAGSFAGEGSIAPTRRGLRLNLLEPLNFAGKHQFAIIDKLHAVLFGKSFRSISHDVNMRALIKHEPRQSYGVADALHAPDASHAHRAAVHDHGVHLYVAVARQEAAFARVEGVVFL